MRIFRAQSFDLFYCIMLYDKMCVGQLPPMGGGINGCIKHFFFVRSQNTQI